jgi:hypothetical protein
VNITAVGLILGMLVCIRPALGDTTLPETGRDSQRDGVVMLNWRATAADKGSLNIALTADGQLVGRTVLYNDADDGAFPPWGCVPVVASKTEIEFICGGSWNNLRAKLRKGLLTFYRYHIFDESDPASLIGEYRLKVIARIHVTGQSLGVVPEERTQQPEGREK